MTIDPDDKYFYCGTTTGDILKINFETKLLVVYGPSKTRYSLGVETIREMKGIFIFFQMHDISFYLRFTYKVNQYTIKSRDLFLILSNSLRETNESLQYSGRAQRVEHCLMSEDLELGPSIGVFVVAKF